MLFSCFVKLKYRAKLQNYHDLHIKINVIYPKSVIRVQKTYLSNAEIWSKTP